MLTIRPTQVDDAFRVSVCISQVACERRFLAALSGFTPLDTRSYIKLLQKKGGFHFVAIDQDIVVGWCDIIPGFFDDIVNVGRLSIGLLLQYRGKGLGQQLLAQVLKAAFLSFIKKIELEVFSSNLAAIRLYQSAGFHEEKRKPKGRKIDGRVEDVLLFGLSREEWRMHEAITPAKRGMVRCAL